MTKNLEQIANEIIGAILIDNKLILDVFTFNHVGFLGGMQQQLIFYYIEEEITSRRLINPITLSKNSYLKTFYKENELSIKLAQMAVQATNKRGRELFNYSLLLNKSSDQDFYTYNLNTNKYFYPKLVE